jgi:hypothetical protein
MKRFIEGEHRGQGTLLPELLDDYVSEDNPVRVVDVFVEELNLAGLDAGGRHAPGWYSSGARRRRRRALGAALACHGVLVTPPWCRARYG